MWQYELHPLHLINVATLPCVSQNAKNIILQWDITKENCMYHNFIKVDQGHRVPYIYLFGVLYSKACMKQRFMTLTTCKNALCKLVLTLTGASSMLHDHLRSRVHAGGGHFKRMLWPECLFVLYDSPEHFIKLPM